MTRDDVVLLLNRLLDDYSLVDLEISNTKLLYTLKKNVNNLGKCPKKI